MSRRRVVVTGIGAVTPLGLSFVDSWKALLSNRSGLVSLEQALQCRNLTQEQLDREWKIAQTLPSQVAAPVQNFESIYSDRTTSRFVQFALVAASEALEQAKLLDDLKQQQQHRIGVSIGSGMSSVQEISNAVRTIDEAGIRKLSPHFVPKVLNNSAAGRVSIEFGLAGPNFTASSACAAGSHAIGEAYNCIRNGVADLMVAGGAEACIDPLSLAGFCRLKALSTSFNDDPEGSSRPFDAQRDGFVMGEGACILVLEELEHAKNRLGDVNDFVALVGYGASGDAHHITSPDPHGSGAIRAMEMAMTDAGDPSIQYINAHATSTPKGDEIEAKAIHQVLQNVHISSTKGATGHLLGAAGAIEAAFTAQSLLDRTIPGTRNLGELDSDVKELHGLSFVDSTTRCDELETALSNSFGFGGTNASLVFRRIRL